jgi:hypothetical protein
LVVSDFIYSPLVVPTLENLKDFGFPENPSGVWSVVPGKDSRQYEEIGDLSALLKARALGHPENTALLGLEGVYDDGVKRQAARSLGWSGKCLLHCVATEVDKQEQ